MVKVIEIGSDDKKLTVRSGMNRRRCRNNVKAGPFTLSAGYPAIRKVSRRRNVD